MMRRCSIHGWKITTFTPFSTRTADSVSLRRGSGAALGAKPADSLEVFREKFRDQSERVLASVYAAWSEEAARIQVPLSVIILPRGDSKARSPRVFQLIRFLCTQNRLDYIDISGAFDHMEVDEFRISNWDKHPNARGHRVMFEALRRDPAPGTTPGPVAVAFGP